MILFTYCVIVLSYFSIAFSKKPYGYIQLPKDDAVIKRELVQWWYWTGFLTPKSNSSKIYGFEVCFFDIEGPLQLVQVAITDVDSNSFTFKEILITTKELEYDSTFNLTAGDINQSNLINAIGGNGSDHLFSQNHQYTLDIDLLSTKKPALHYNGLAHEYSFGGYTFYYSRTRMDILGSLQIGDDFLEVTGTGWFDRQYGDLWRAVTKGWQWFAIDLDSNNQIMVFDFIDNDGNSTTEKYGSNTNPSGITTQFSADEYNLTILDYWTSPHTNCTYPSGWKLTIKDDEYIIKPMVLDQELGNRSNNSKLWLSPRYWEGACSVTGVGSSYSGKAYVELNGYCHYI